MGEQAAEYGRRFSEAVATELRAQRGRVQITFDELADLTGLNKKTVINYLNNRREIPLPAFLDLCQALRVDPRAIFAAAEDHVKQ